MLLLLLEFEGLLSAIPNRKDNVLKIIGTKPSTCSFALFHCETIKELNDASFGFTHLHTSVFGYCPVT